MLLSEIVHGANCVFEIDDDSGRLKLETDEFDFALVETPNHKNLNNHSAT